MRLFSPNRCFIRERECLYKGSASVYLPWKQYNPAKLLRLVATWGWFSPKRDWISSQHFVKVTAAKLYSPCPL